MIKYCFWGMLICFGMACKQKAEKRPVTQCYTPGAKHLPIDMMITPGGGIGKITIGENADSVAKALGKPDSSDAAMGSKLVTWYDKHNPKAYQLNVFSHRNMGANDEAISRVKAIRVTSPVFNTSEMIHADVPFSEIKKCFSLRKITSPNKKGVTIYNDQKGGIAFEVNGKNICTAIIVFARDGGSMTYLNMGQ
jgi:hypothetical protein